MEYQKKRKEKEQVDLRAPAPVSILHATEGVILPIVTLGTIRPEDSGAARNATEFQH